MLCGLLGGHRHFSKFASLGCATGDTAMILVPRATHSPGHNATHQHHSTPAPQHNKEPTTRNQQQPQLKQQHRHQHHHNNQHRKPVYSQKKKTATTRQHATTPSINNQQQPSTMCTATRTGTTPATAATATTAAIRNNSNNQVAPHTAPSRNARACAQNKGHRQQQQQLQRKITSHGIKQHGNSVAASSDSGSTLLRFLVSNSKTHARHAKNAVVHQ